MALIHVIVAVSMLLFSLVASASANYGGYEPKYDPKKSKPYLPLPEKEKSLPQLMGIQGLIYCKSGPQLIPLEGAVARITCLAVDENGYETAPFSILSGKSNKKGYFFATLPASKLEDNCKLTQCKAFLDYSPMETCKIPTDINKGISGALLSSYRTLNEKKMNLYSVAPLVYTSEPKPVPKKGY